MYWCTVISIRLEHCALGTPLRSEQERPCICIQGWMVVNGGRRSSWIRHTCITSCTAFSWFVHHSSQVISCYILQESQLAIKETRSHRNITLLPTTFYQKWVLYLQNKKGGSNIKGRQKTKAGVTVTVNHPCNAIEVQWVIWSGRNTLILAFLFLSRKILMT